MNLLFVYYLPSGGVETLNRQRAVAFLEKGINVHFLYYQKKRELVNKHQAPTFITNDNQEIKSIIDRGNYDAIIITSDYHGLARFRDLGYKGLLIYEIQGLGTVDQAELSIQHGFPTISTHANGILLSITPHIIDILKKHPPHPPRFIFNNCFASNQFMYLPKATHHQPILAWIGRFEPNKNWKEFVLLGHKLINEYNGQIQLYMFEDHTLSIPTERAKFNKLINELRIKEHVTIFSNIPHEQMPYYFSKIGNSGGVLCSTSITEGFGYAIVEAMVCRCPVLSTLSDGVSQSIVHDHTGKFYQIGQVDEAYLACRELMENIKLREYIRDNAIVHVNTQFNTNLYVNHFTQMIEQLRQTVKDQDRH